MGGLKLQIKSINKTYKKGMIKANSNITVTLKANEITALIGHNGAGKTTLLNQIIGNVKPDNGAITFNGISFVDDTKAARNYVSMMPQFHAPIAGVTLRQAIESVLRIRGLSTRLIRSYTNQVIKDLNIEQWANQSGDKLSGGLQRLTSFAMSVVYPAKIILLDEPTNDIDPMRRKLVWQYMRKLAKEGHIILVVTHNLLEVEQYADRYILMENGQIISDALTSALNRRFASNILSINFNDFYDLQNIPSSVEYKFISDEMKIILTLSSRQVSDAIQWVLNLMEEGKVLNYKLTSATLDVSYGGWSMRDKVQSDGAMITDLKKLWGIIHWSLIRHKYLIPTFSIVQGVFAVAIICGMALLIPEIDDVAVIYLSSGALTLNIIAVGCVLASQIVSEAKQNGMFKYQKTLPVPRCIILLSDIIIWGIAALPGIVMGCIAAVLRFDVKLQTNLTSIVVILISQFVMICIGFCIAYWFPPNMMALATQLIMIGGLLFSPITYPAERLPQWTAYIYQALPFVPISNLIRSTLFLNEHISYCNLIVVLLWGIVAFSLALCALSKRD